MLNIRSRSLDTPLACIEENTFVLRGRLDAATVRQHKQQMLDELLDHDGSVILSMSEVPFVDSTGLGFLVALHKACAERGHRLLLCEPEKQLRVLLELTRLHQVFAIFDSVEQARLANG